MRIGYKDIFERNEYAQDLAKDKLKNLVVEMTGLEPKDGSVSAVVGSFRALRDFADFDATPKPGRHEQGYSRASRTASPGSTTATAAAGL